jgi:hypothetical protein
LRAVLRPVVQEVVVGENREQGVDIARLRSAKKVRDRCRQVRVSHGKCGGYVSTTRGESFFRTRYNKMSALTSYAL